jgi:uncharacterized protein with HEPN domain
VRDDLPYLEYIQESIQHSESYLHWTGGGFDEELLDDHLTRDAVLRRLETLSDAAGQPSDTLKSRHPEISWRKVTDFRNFLAHGYLRIRAERVAAVLKDDLGAVKIVVENEILSLRGSI